MKYIRVLVIMFALMWGAVSGAWAQLTASDIEYEVKPSASGTIEKSVNATTREVTLTVAPASGYYIKASDFVVEKLVNTGNANAPKRRVSEITDLITGKLYSGSGRAETDIISSVTYPNSAQYVFTLPADYDGAYVTATFHLLTENEIIRITRSTSLGESPSMSAHYVLVEDVSATVVDVFYSAGTFTGTFEGEPKADGSFPTISGLEHALFQTVDGGTVKNIVLDNVTIAGSTYYTSVTVGNQSKKATGAIANVATGASRIYNCGVQATGSSVTTDKDGYTLFSTTNDAEKKPQHTESSSTVGGVDYVGGLVGFLNGTARVINCYSYADITSGSNVGGIVGWNNYKTKATDLQTMVMNCMFYGNIDYTATTSRAPIYNGEIITNRSDQSGVSNFNYFWAGAIYVQERMITSGKYNCALSAETRYLQRFEFFRHLLNGHRELAAWWVQGADFEKDEMAKWVMEPSQIGTTTPYPILKAQGKYSSVVNYEPSDETIDANNEHRNEGRKLGTLSVTIRMGSNSPFDAPTGARLKSGQSMTLTLPITDKDPAHFNFNYGKVQLPYYNDYGIGNYTGNRVVTGWKIVSISGGTHGFSTGDDATASVNDNGDITLTTPYNFADRKCTDKDKFDVSGRVFNQGAYFDVPEGVSSIIIEPYWAKAVFVADDYRDVVCNQAMNSKSGVGTVGGGQWFDVGSGTNVSHDFTFAGEGAPLTLKVHNTITNAVATLFSGESTAEKKVYDYAVVLVGNVHSLDISNKEKTKPYTIMSIDLDKDNEPDYSYILRFDSRVRVHPVRVDFLNIPGLGMAQKSTGGSGTYNFGIMQTYGWFESTNTSLFRVTQFEYDYVNSSSSGSNRANSPMILQGGVIEQWVTVGGSEDNHKEAQSVTYYHVGGNVWFKEFHIGVHQDKNLKTNKNPNPDQFVSKHPPISVTGGDYNEFYLTGLYNTPNNNYDDNAECYINGGRFNKVAGTGMQGIGNLSTHENGNITWQIDNADINEFYGGGINAAHISEGNIMTVISNSRVDQFCGGPKFGNMNGNKKVATNATNCIFRTFFGAGYGGNSYNRRYPSNINNVQNTDWNSWVLTEYTNKYDSNYGGVETRIDYQFIPMSGNASNVARLFVDYVSFSLATTHNVTSKLTDCTITTSPLGSLELFSQSVGNFYGGGNLGMVDGPVKSTLTNCTVEGNVFGGGYSATLPTVAVMNNSFQTEPYYDSNLGAYLDAELPTTVPYTWEHATEAEFNNKQIDTGKHILYTTEDLTGLGAVTGNVTLTIDGNTTLTNGKRMSVSHSVYGGGEESNVEGNTQVNITGGTITENVFGGGKGEADEFSCSKAMVGVNDEGKCEDPGSETNKDKGTIVTISNGTVNGNVYGGGEVGRVEWNTQVKIGIGTGDGPFAPVINGNVFGAGKGKETHGYAALVRGNSSVTIQGNAKVGANVYGGGEQATVGRYWVKGIPTTLCPDDANETVVPPAPDGLPNEMPYKTRRGGKSTVIVQGKAQIGPNDGGTETAGHVFGAGKGVTPNYVHTGEKANWSKRMVDYSSTKHTGEPGTTWDYYPDDHNYVWEYFTTEDKYFEFLQTLALVTGTDVTISGTAKVKGSVYGGSESGYVQDDTDVKITGGTIGTSGSGGAYYGNVYGGGKGDVEHMGTEHKYVAAGLVKGNTNVSISGMPTIWHNVYGGGAYGSVGEFTYDATTGLPTALATANTGACTVTITGGTLGSNGSENGMVFGSSRGDVDSPGDDGVDPNDRLAWVYSTHVTIGDTSAETTPWIKGSVYGSGENGHTFQNTIVDIQKGTIGITTGEDIGDYSGALYPYRGNVYGGGCGTDMYDSDGDKTEDSYNPLAGIVRGNATVNISGGHVVHNVYGAGAMGSVGNDADANSGKTTINISGGRIGHTGERDGNVFGAARGEYGISTDLSNNLANVRESEVNITYATTPTADNQDKTEKLIAGSVFGGGESGTVKGSVAVKMTGGLILKDIYGGGALADTQTSNWDATNNTWANTTSKSALNTTAVRLTGGTILGEAYGGGLGEAASTNYTNGRPAYVWGDVLVDLNNNNNGGDVDDTAKGCAVGQIFGCNNINGTPKGDVMVHVYATQNAKKDNIATKFMKTNVDLGDMTNINSIKASISSLNAATPEEKTDAEKDFDAKYAIYTDENSTDAQKQTVLANMKSIILLAIAEELGISTTEYTDASTDAEKQTALENIQKSINANANRYDVQAVYGGGNMAAYEPVNALSADETTKASATTNVIIDGCGLTSIQNVYGGGNAASTPATNLTINGTYEIDEVFGGGNGKDDIVVNNETKPNPGANVGFYDYSADETTYNTKDKRQLDAFTSKYVYGTGKASLNIYGGTIHRVFGGSNTKGNVRQTAVTMLEEVGGCDFCVDEAYGGGKSAPMDAEAKLLMACIPGLNAAYGGAEAADIQGNVSLTITNGRFSRVFGGNNLSGTIRGAIKVNVEEVGCKPIIIGELYGGGNEAGYSIYGYKQKTEGGKLVWKPRESASDNTADGECDNLTTPYADPQVNVKSFTSIGAVYGGGYGKTAVMVGNPTVNVSVVEGAWKEYVGESSQYEVKGYVYDATGYKGETITITDSDGTTTHDVELPNHAKGKIGAIGQVFGGGNAAPVKGNTTVNIGTLEKVSIKSYVEKTITEGTSLEGLYTRSGEGTAASPYRYTAATGTAVEGTTYYEEKNVETDVVGVDIRGNVYGGGNNAEVTGNTNVQIGKKM